MAPRLARRRPAEGQRFCGGKSASVALATKSAFGLDGRSCCRWLPRSGAVLLPGGRSGAGRRRGHEINVRIAPVTFGRKLNDVSAGRNVTRGPNIDLMPSRRPRPERPARSNTAPLPWSHRQQSVHQGQTLSFVASATDWRLAAENADLQAWTAAASRGRHQRRSGLFNCRPQACPRQHQRGHGPSD